MLESPTWKFGKLLDQFCDSALFIKERDESGKRFHDVLNVGSHWAYIDFRRENCTVGTNKCVYQQWIPVHTAEIKTNHELATELGFSV